MSYIVGVMQMTADGRWAPLPGESITLRYECETAADVGVAIEMMLDSFERFGGDFDITITNLDPAT